MVGETDTIVRASVTVFSNVATKVFAKGTIFLIPEIMFPISATMVPDLDTIISVSKTMVGDTETIVRDTETMFSDDR
jgi:hypothetical protein